MRSASVLILALFLAGCSDDPFSDPLHGASLIVVNVHWDSKGVGGIPVTVVGTGDSTNTGSNGLAIFTVAEGHYIVRAYGINRGGPIMISNDYEVDAKPGGPAIVDIVDCLPCL